MSVDIPDTNNQQINDQSKKLTDKFNQEILEKLNGVIDDSDIKIILINNIKTISEKEIIYNTDCFEITAGLPEPFTANLSSDFQLQDKESLITLLSYLKANYNHDRVMISTYGHGSMFGIFGTHNFKNDNKLTNYTLLEKKDMDYWNVVSPNIEKNSISLGEEKVEYALALKQFGKDRYAYKQTKALDYMDVVVEPRTLGSFEKFKVLSNEEFAEAIATTFGKINFLLFNNCVMQNIYAQFSFKHVVNYLVAPETGIVYPCFNLKGIIEFIKNNKNQTDENISEFIAKSFKQEFNLDYVKYQTLIEEFICISVNLDNSDEIFRTLGELKTYLTEELKGSDRNTLACDISNSLDDTYPMEYDTNTGQSIFDLVQLLASDYLKKYPVLLRFRDRLVNLTADSIRYHIGNTAYNAGYKTYANNKGISGLGVYFPKKRKMQNAYITPYFNSITYQNDLELGLKWYSDVIEAYLNIMNQ